MAIPAIRMKSQMLRSSDPPPVPSLVAVKIQRTMKMSPSFYKEASEYVTELTQ